MIFIGVQRWKGSYKVAFKSIKVMKTIKKLFTTKYIL